MPIPLQEKLLYGPVDSRRYGRSLGINPLPLERKLCSLSCEYCQYGSDARTNGPTRIPETLELIAALQRGLQDLAEAGDFPDRITIAGNGEPTLHPGFHVWAYSLADVRDQVLGKDVPIGLLSNGMHLHHSSVREAIEDCVDDPCFKLEVGRDETFESMYHADRKAFARMLDALRELDRFSVQALFVHGPKVDNATAAEVDAWLDRLEALKPRIERVEIYTIAREPDPKAQLRALNEDELFTIAARTRDAGHQVELVA